MIRKTLITLEVAWDDEECGHPTTWEWADLIDTFPDESVTVVDHTDADEHEMMMG